ncbi:MAG: hypothetical protein V1748_07780 [Actinomycetota bacterium]
MAEEQDQGASAADELEKLRAENEALKAQLSTGKKPRGRFWISFVVWLLIVLGSISAFGGVLATWLRTTALDTKAFTSTIVPVVKEDAVAKAISDIAVQRLFEQVDIVGKVESAVKKIDPELDFIAEPIAGGLESAAKKAAEEILKSDQFQVVLDKIVSLAHSQAVKVLTGEGNVSINEQGQVVLDIGALLNGIKDDLVEQGLTVLENVPIPESAGQVTLFEAEQLGAIKHGVDLLETLNWLLPALSLVFFGVAIVIAPDRRKATMGVGIGLAIATAIVLIALNITKVVLLDQMKVPANKEAAQVIWTHLFHGLRVTDWGLLVFGLLLAIGAAVAGPYKWAVWVRTKVGGLFAGWRERRKGGEEAPGPVSSFLGEHAWALRIAGAVVVFLLLLLLPTSVVTVVVLAVVLLVYLAAIELLR